MKKVVVAAALVLASFSPALASHYEVTYHDTLRPGGHQRSLATGNAARDSCHSQSGISPEDAPTQAVKDCMKAQGFRWMSTKLVRDPPVKQAAIPKGHFIDQDTGLLCHNTGGASICESPPADMTVRYTDEDGLNCTRTGGVAVCSSF